MQSQFSIRNITCWWTPHKPPGTQKQAGVEWLSTLRIVPCSFWCYHGWQDTDILTWFWIRTWNSHLIFTDETPPFGRMMMACFLWTVHVATVVLRTQQLLPHSGTHHFAWPNSWQASRNAASDTALALRQWSVTRSKYHSHVTEDQSTTAYSPDLALWDFVVSNKGLPRRSSVFKLGRCPRCIQTGAGSNIIQIWLRIMECCIEWGYEYIQKYNVEIRI